MADLNVTAVNALFAALVSMLKSLGPFKEVMTHEPKSAPTSFPSCAIWWERLAPAASGLASVSVTASFNIRVYQASMLEKPEDGIDPGLLKNVCLIMKALSGDFSLGGTVRAVDLLGMEGQPLAATSGYIAHDGRLMRVAQIPVYVIINDAWDEVA